MNGYEEAYELLLLVLEILGKQRYMENTTHLFLSISHAVFGFQ